MQVVVLLAVLMGVQDPQEGAPSVDARIQAPIVQQQTPVVRSLPQNAQRDDEDADDPENENGVETIARPTLQLRPTIIRPDVVQSLAAPDSSWLDGGENGPVEATLFRLPGAEEAMPIQYEAVDGVAIAEGDIILGPLDEIRSESSGRACSGELCSIASPLIATNNASYLWPGGIIFYEPPEDMPEEMWDRFERGMAHITSVTDLQFVERTNQRDYVAVNYTEDRVCNATIGRRGGRQSMNISLACWPNEIAHEFLHVAGIWHEHSRADRDQFVEILWENIRPGEEHNFENRGEVGRSLGRYDYQSIMHYATTAFGREDENGRRLPTLRILRPDLPQRTENGLSFGDIAGLQALYGAEDCFRFEPGTARAQRYDDAGGWTLVASTPSGETRLHAFRGQDRNSELAARRAARALNQQLADQYCYIDRRSRTTYLLSQGVLPSGPSEHEDCIAFRPDTLTIDRSRRSWRVVAESPSARQISLAAHDEAGLAYRQADTLQRFGARYQCFANRGANAFIYWRS